VVAHIAAGAVAAAFLVLAGYRVKQRNWPRAALAASIAIGLAAYASGILPTPDDAREATEDAADSLGVWLYPFIAGVAVLESFPPPFCAAWPGEFAVIFAGAIAARDEGKIDIVPLIAIVWAASALADSASFALGRRYGRGLLERYGPTFRVTPERLERLDRWFDRWGTAVVALGRLLPVARPLGPFVAGTSALPYHRFLRWNLVGVTLFSILFPLLGYLFYESYDELVVVIGRVGLGALAVGLVVVVIVARRRRRRA
jgi:membrane protein DedA with SNARE-associated domain